MTEVLDKEVEKGICADAPDGLSAFRQFGRIFATTMPQFVSEDQMLRSLAMMPRPARVCNVTGSAHVVTWLDALEKYGIDIAIENQALKQVASRARALYCRTPRDAPLRFHNCVAC
jgi:hypothetical protein